VDKYPNMVDAGSAQTPVQCLGGGRKWRPKLPPPGRFAGESARVMSIIESRLLFEVAQ
jgi:hypothetical protein